MHKLIRKLKKMRRGIYGLRGYVPWLRERHRLETMVGPLGYWNKLQAYQFSVLKANGLLPHHRLLDIGCGPLQGGIAFIRYLDRGNYFGIDVKRESLEAGKAQIAKYGLTEKTPFISVSHTFGREELTGETFDYMWASQVMYYFDEERVRDLMATISSRLEETGMFLGDIIGPKHHEFRTREFGWRLHSIESLAASAREFRLKVRKLGEIEQFGYPRRLELRTNVLVEITKRSG